MPYRNKYKLKEKEKAKVLRARIFIKEFKKRGCSICSYSKCLDALIFHHIGKDKDRAVNRIHTIKKAQKEISKCILVCSNCHAEIHSKERLEGILTGSQKLVSPNVAQLQLWEH